MTMQHPNQITGNSGLYWACYRLSQLGWNAMPTSRNARGIDIVCFSMDGTRMFTVQVKSLSKRNPVPLGNDLHKIGADLWIIVDCVTTHPRACIMLPREVKRLAVQNYSRKTNQPAYWLSPSKYEQYIDRWDIIDQLNP